MRRKKPYILFYYCPLQIKISTVYLPVLNGKQMFGMIHAYSPLSKFILAIRSQSLI